MNSLQTLVSISTRAPTQRCDVAVAEECGASAADMRWRGGGGTFLGKAAQVDPSFQTHIEIAWNQAHGSNK
jgi:hypothetical protein